MDLSEDDVCSYPGCKESTVRGRKAVCVKHGERAMFAPSQGGLEVVRLAGTGWLDSHVIPDKDKNQLRMLKPVKYNTVVFHDLRDMASSYCKYTATPAFKDGIKLEVKVYGDYATSLQYWVDKNGTPIFKPGHTHRHTHTHTHTHRLSVWHWFWLWFQPCCETSRCWVCQQCQHQQLRACT